VVIAISGFIPSGYQEIRDFTKIFSEWTEFTTGYGNYTEERKALFADMTLDDLLVEMSKVKHKPPKKSRVVLIKKSAGTFSATLFFVPTQGYEVPTMPPYVP
jgi:hypothetical protein